MKMGLLRHIVVVMAAMMAVMLTSVPLCAQSADMAALWKKINANIRKPEVLALSDSLRKMAVSKGAWDMEMNALTVPMKYHYYNKSGIKTLEAAMRPLMGKSLKYNQTQYFYSAVSFKVTYLINEGKYGEALEYQEKMLEYAKAHGHHQGVVLGHVSLGNVYRMRMRMVQAIDEYKQAIEGYKKYSPTHELGQDYKRIAECYMIIGRFDKAVETIDEGLGNTNYEPRINGMLGDKAYSLCMLGKDDEFDKVYSQYKSRKTAQTDIFPDVDRCVDVMKKINDGKLDEVDAILKEKKIDGFWMYVKVYYDVKRKQYRGAADGIEKLFANLFGDETDTGVYLSSWSKMSAVINNNIQYIERQRAINEQSQLELDKTNLELQKQALMLKRLENAEKMSMLDAENNRMAYNNQKLVSAKLRDSIKEQQWRKTVEAKEAERQRLLLAVQTGVILLLLLVALVYFYRSSRLAKKEETINSQLQHTKKDLEVASEKAKEADNMKTIFLQDISHELRTPLNSIVGFSQVLTDMDDSLGEQEKQEINQQVRENSKQLSKLINDILDLTKLESGKLVLDEKDVQINSLCRETMNSMRDDLAEGVELLYETSLPDDYVVKTDAAYMRQVLVNLLANAEKNTVKGSITLSCDAKDGNILFAVTDTGIGIPKEKQKDLFQLFSKIDTFKQGMGLGLALCHSIVEHLGGDIYIDSEYTGGARFCFTIPSQH